MAPIPKFPSRGEKGSHNKETHSKVEPVRNNPPSDLTAAVNVLSNTMEKLNKPESPEDIKPSDSGAISPSASERFPESDDSEEFPAEDSVIEYVDSWVDNEAELYRIKRDQKPSPEAIVYIPDRSPTSSDFGTVRRSNLRWEVTKLPTGILDYLEEGKLEAYFVKGDGNCLYHAVTFHPQFTKSLLARNAAAAMIDGTHQNSHILKQMVDGEQLQKIQTPGNWLDSDIGEPQILALAEALRVKIVVHDFSSYDPTQSNSGSRRPAPRIYCPRADQKLLFEEPVEILLYGQHYYPIFKFGTFPDSSLPHYRGKDFVPAKPRGATEEAIKGISTALDQKKDPFPNLTPDPVDRQEVVPAAHHIQSVKGGKTTEAIPPESAIKLPQKDNKVVLSEPAKLDLKPLKAPTPVKPLFNLDPPERVGSVTPPETSPTAEPTLGQNILKGLALAAGASIVVGGLVALGDWLQSRFVKKKSEKKSGQEQRMMREIEVVVEPEDEGSGDETVVSAKW